MENILQSWEIESFVDSLKISTLEDIGTKRWFEFHKKLMLLNQQNILEINNMQEESVKEWLVSLNKIPILIYEAIQVNVWKQKAFPLMVEIYGEPQNTFLIFSVFYHEELAASLLESALFHSDSAQTLDDTVLDLVDYAVNNVTLLIHYEENGKKDAVDVPENQTSCLEELLEKREELEFNIAMRCISILRYLAEFADNLPLAVLSRMLMTHDVPYLLTRLIETQPWRRIGKDGEKMVYHGNWRKVDPEEEGKVSKIEGQVWFGLRELLLNPKCAPYYEMTEFRLSQLSRLQKYLQEILLDQLPPLAELRAWLTYLNISASTNTQRPITVEMIPQIRSSIQEKYHKKWKKLVKLQAQSLFTTDIEYIKTIAQILSDAYDWDKLDCIDAKKCGNCKGSAKQRCSQCKKVWYCGRECQVNDWKNHKSFCESN